MANSTIVTNTDPNVDAAFPKVTGTTTDTNKHAMDVAVLFSVNTAKLDTIIELLQDILSALGSSADALLLENGDNLLLENGDLILLE